MSISRRHFLAGAGVAATGLVGPGRLLGLDPARVHGADTGDGGPGPETGRRAGGQPGTGEGPGPGALQAVPADRFDPWIEVDPSALAFNVGVISRLTGGRPILAVTFQSMLFISSPGVYSRTSSNSMPAPRKALRY